jgi:hypothetical protein
MGWLLTYPLMGPVVRFISHGWILKLPVALSISTFLGLQAMKWQRPCQPFHDIMAQPAPHGTYLRRTIKVSDIYTLSDFPLQEHFPVLWYDTSKTLHENGYSLPEMNEYDKRTEIPNTHTKFDASFY